MMMLCHSKKKCPQCHHDDVMSFENAPASLNWSFVSTQNILWGHGHEVTPGEGKTERRMNSLPVSEGKALTTCARKSCLVMTISKPLLSTQPVFDVVLESDALPKGGD